MKRPNSMRHLDDAIRRLCGGAPQDFVRARTVTANAIMASMLPDGVVKGDSALKMRFGEENTRFTTDLDTATATDPAVYAALAEACPCSRMLTRRFGGPMNSSPGSKTPGKLGRKRTGGAGLGKARSRNGACLLLLSCHAIKTP